MCRHWCVGARFDIGQGPSFGIIRPKISKPHTKSKNERVGIDWRVYGCCDERSLEEGFTPEYPFPHNGR